MRRQMQRRWQRHSIIPAPPGRAGPSLPQPALCHLSALALGLVLARATLRRGVGYERNNTCGWRRRAPAAVDVRYAQVAAEGWGNPADRLSSCGAQVAALMRPSFDKIPRSVPVALKMQYARSKRAEFASSEPAGARAISAAPLLCQDTCGS